MLPQIGDEVAVTHLGRSDLGSLDVVTDYGRLGLELDGAGFATGLVLEGDGSATFIPQTAVIRVELMS